MIYQLIGIVLLATIARYAVGVIWYMPKGLFGKKWLALQGKDPATMEKPKSMPIVKGLLVAFVSTFILGLFLIGQNGVEITSALFVGLLLWAAFIAPTILSRKLYDVNQTYSWKLFYIDASHELVAILAAVAVFAWLI